MKMTVSLAKMVGLVSTVLLVSVGCGENSSEDLHEECDACGDATLQAACQEVVDNDDDDSCETYIDAACGSS